MTLLNSGCYRTRQWDINVQRKNSYEKSSAFQYETKPQSNKIHHFFFLNGSLSNPSCLSLCSSAFKFEFHYQQIKILAKCAFLKKHFQYKAESWYKGNSTSLCWEVRKTNIKGLIPHFYWSISFKEGSEREQTHLKRL